MGSAIPDFFGIQGQWSVVPTMAQGSAAKVNRTPLKTSGGLWAHSLYAGSRSSLAFSEVPRIPLFISLVLKLTRMGSVICH